MTFQWYFAPSNGGQTSGLNDSGVSYFASDPVRSITKETLQDSIDALHPSHNKTIVKFDMFEITKDEIPGYNDLLKSFNNGIKHWKHHVEKKRFFKEGLDYLQKEKIPVLSIKDYQTIGLSKVVNKKTGGWYTLILSSGVTEKSSTEGGSYGIGKNAPFAASALRTVFYTTKNRADQIGFQGVAKIPTITNEKNEDTQGTGYFYHSKTREPIMTNEEIFSRYQRSDYGTDKYIIGFNDQENWQDRVIEEVISSYLIAIYRESLEVHVDNFIINKQTLPEAIKKVRKSNKDNLALQYYEVLKSSHSKKFEAKFKTETGELEKITLNLLLKDNFIKRVGMNRSTGMKIYDKGHFRIPIDFSGVLIVEGKSLNETLRKMEPPTHDAWDSNLFDGDKKYGRKLIKEINEWLHECVNSLLDTDSQKSLQIKGIEEVLPNFSDDPKTVTIDKGKKDKVVSLNPRKKRKKRRKLSGKSGEFGKGDPEEKRTGKDKGKFAKKPSQHEKVAGIARVHAYCTNPTDQIYSILFSTKNAGNVSFSIKAIGENSATEKVEIISAKIKEEHLKINENIVKEFYAEANSEYHLELELNTANRLALEVIQL